MSFNESWFWCGPSQWASKGLDDRFRPRLQIIRKATLWQRWLLWLQQPLRYVMVILVLLSSGVPRAMTTKKGDAASPSGLWTGPVEPPGVVVVTHNSAAALAAKYKATALNETEPTTDKPMHLASTRTATAQTPATTAAPNLEKSAATQASLEQALQTWSSAWQQKNVPAYLAMYAPDFETQKAQSRQAWAQMRTQRIQSKRSIRHDMRQMRVSLDGLQAHVSFEQHYADERLKQTDQKNMLWIWREGQWRIARETTS